MSTAVSNGINMNHVSEDCGPPFKHCGPPFKHYMAWKVLHNLDKYKCAYENAMVGERECGTGDGNVRGSSPEDSIIKLENGSLSDKTESDEKDAEQKIRPTGRRKAEELLRKSKQTEKNMRLEEESVATHIEPYADLKRHYEILLFKSAPEGCDQAECVEYFNIMPYKALKELRKTSPDVPQEVTSVSKDAIESRKAA
ncbi:hypothetical protein BWQ96_06072 [Gracilariopsis chorda]|uniref:Uncharacterized protein n=1 Tax=Gracilariopsis chorda TaxID=448386 RepID=A0A2V3IQ50_9FLOR|nr:hypothetical protein BWQ96_06072 [Gracilariopsis chorda]|eukprot:PXF44212.1 hypothetical protein BWQ96_06072 [Gracilariopsis chorda]